jgi:PKHD-type hydroxylase
MLSSYPLLTEDECDAIVSDLDRLNWKPGLAPGELYRERVKGNKEIAFQMSESTMVADEHIRHITSKIMSCQFIRERMFPKSLVNPRFNLYEDGGFYGKHADSAFMGGVRQQIRTDLSVTLFLTDPTSYEGGELSLEYASGAKMRVKEPKGTIIFYPSGVMHQVQPVTAGRRIAFVAWIESHIQNPQRREILTEITNLCDDMMQDQNLALGDFHTRAMNIKHNLFRVWWRNES